MLKSFEAKLIDLHRFVTLAWPTASVAQQIELINNNIDNKNNDDDDDNNDSNDNHNYNDDDDDTDITIT